MKCTFMRMFGLGKELTSIQELFQKMETNLYRSIETSRKLVESISAYEEKYQYYLKRKQIYTALDLCSSDYKWAKDLDGRFTFVNERFRNNFLFHQHPIGLTEAQIVNQNTGIPEDEAITCGSSDNETIESGDTMKFLERFEVGGKTFVMDVTKTVVKDSYGAIVGTAGIGRDVTEMYNAFNDIEYCISSECCNREKIKDLRKHMELYHG